MTTSFWVVDIVRECRCIPEVREILKIEKELSYVTYMHSISTAIYSTMIADSYTQGHWCMMLEKLPLQRMCLKKKVS